MLKSLVLAAGLAVGMLFPTSNASADYRGKYYSGYRPYYGNYSGYRYGYAPRGYWPGYSNYRPYYRGYGYPGYGYRGYGYRGYGNPWYGYRSYGYPGYYARPGVSLGFWF
jgi:hypothetical protein